MALDNDQVISKLNHILGTLLDGEKGYREAAEEAESSQYTTMFNELAQQRGRFASEVSSEIRRLGGEPRDHTSAGAALHRVWLNVREAISGKGDEAVIAEAERGEDSAVSNYQDVMNDDLPSNVKTMLSQQYAEVKAAHDRISNMKHAN
ncbi:PA2169 family four-helix-bundle protein [soil metagenome]